MAELKCKPHMIMTVIHDVREHNCKISPEQVRISVKENESDDAQSLRAEPETTQADLIHHTGVDEDFCFCTEPTKPQSRRSQTAASTLGLQSDNTTGFHSARCFISSLPSHRLDPPTNLISVSEGEKIRVNLINLGLQWDPPH